MKEEIETIISQIMEDLKIMAKEHGAIVVFVLAIIYLWRKIK